MIKKFLFLIILVSNDVKSQNQTDVNMIMTLLKDNSENQVHSRLKAYQSIEKLNEKEAMNFISAAENCLKNESKEIKTRWTALKSRILFYKLQDGDSLYASLMKFALKESYELDNQYMIAEYSRWYGEMINSIGHLQEAIQHCAYAVQIQDLLGQEHFPNYHEFCLNLAELLYKSAYFEEALPYFYSGLDNANNITHPDLVGNSFLAAGISLRVLNKFDSSLFFLEKGMKYALKTNQQNLYYACNRNRFESFYELKKIDSCKKVVDDVFEFAEILGNRKDALAAAFQIKGKLLRFQNQISESIRFLKLSVQYRNESNLSKLNTHAYKDLYEIYFELNDSISGEKYLNYYQDLINARNATKAAFNSDYILAKAKFEKEQIKFKSYLKEIEKKRTYSNIIFFTIIAFSLLSIWYFNKKRKLALISKIESEKKLESKKVEFIKKENEIQELRLKIETKEINLEKIEKINLLASKTILTEYEWEHFQLEFNQIFPQFIFTLKDKFKGITESEIRFAILHKMKFNTKQIAGILGISADSVHKGRQRLRIRLNVNDSEELDTMLNNLD